MLIGSDVKEATPDGTTVRCLGTMEMGLSGETLSEHSRLLGPVIKKYKNKSKRYDFHELDTSKYPPIILLMILAIIATKLIHQFLMLKLMNT